MRHFLVKYARNILRGSGTSIALRNGMQVKKKEFFVCAGGCLFFFGDDCMGMFPSREAAMKFAAEMDKSQ